MAVTRFALYGGIGRPYAENAFAGKTEQEGAFDYIIRARRKGRR